MNIRFYINPATGQPYISNHAVLEAEVEDVCMILAKIGRVVKVQG